jgi:excisionase family DNA binding protein
MQGIVVAFVLPDGRWLAMDRVEFAAALQHGAELMGGAAPAARGARAAATTEKLLNSRELAAVVNCNDTLLEQMAKDGRIPSLRIGRLLRFEPAAVLAALRDAGSGPSP